MGLLDDLKKQADDLKAKDTDRTESMRTTAVAVDHALRRVFLYMNDLGKQLNVVQMPSPFKYNLPTVGDCDGLIVKDFFCDFRSKHFIDKDYYGEVHCAYRAWSDKILTVKKGPEEMEKFRDVLWQSNLEHKSEQFRDQRKVITHEVFKINSEFRVQGKIEGDHESGKIKIATKNVGGLEVDLFMMMALEFNEKAVEEFAKYFIGRPNNWADLVKRSVLVRPTSGAFPSKPKVKTEPQYVVQKEPAAAPEEKKGGLFGSLKALIKKD